MPDDRAIVLTLPPDPQLTTVAAVAVRAAARQVALSEAEIDRLRAAVTEAFVAQATNGEEPIRISLHPDQGRMTIEVGSTVIE